MTSQEELQRKVQETETVIDKLNAIRDQLSAMAFNIQALPIQYMQPLQNYINRETSELTRYVRGLINLHDNYERQLLSVEEGIQLPFTPQLKKPLPHYIRTVPYVPHEELVKKYAPGYYETVQRFNEAVRKNVKPEPYTSGINPFHSSSFRANYNPFTHNRFPYNANPSPNIKRKRYPP